MKLLPTKKEREFSRIKKDISEELRKSAEANMYEIYSILNKAGDGDIYNIDPRKMPFWAAGNPAWDYLPEKELEKILSGMLRHITKWAIEHTPVYRIMFEDKLDDIKIDDIVNARDMLELPIMLAKDDMGDQKGFRELALEDPKILVPDDLEDVVNQLTLSNTSNKILLKEVYGNKPIWKFPSGGSKGKQTWTTLSYLDLEAESQRLAVWLKRGGFYHGAKFFSLYNDDTHKGGHCLRRASRILEVEYYNKSHMDNYLRKKFGNEWTDLVKKLEDKTAKEDDIANIGTKISEYIKDMGFNIIAAVQPSDELLQKNEKGSGITFRDIYDNRVPGSFDNVLLVFLTGTGVPEETYKLLWKDRIGVFSILGSGESMENAAHPLLLEYGKLSKISKDPNDFLLTHYPNYLIPARYNGEHKKWVECKEGEVGFAIVATPGRGAGTYFVCYNMADICTKTSYGIRYVHKSGGVTRIAGSCAEDATQVR